MNDAENAMTFPAPVRSVGGMTDGNQELKKPQRVLWRREEWM